MLCLYMNKCLSEVFGILIFHLYLHEDDLIFETDYLPSLYQTNAKEQQERCGKLNHISVYQLIFVVSPFVNQNYTVLYGCWHMCFMYLYELIADFKKKCLTLRDKYTSNMMCLPITCKLVPGLSCGLLSFGSSF